MGQCPTRVTARDNPKHRGRVFLSPPSWPGLASERRSSSKLLALDTHVFPKSSSTSMAFPWSLAENYLCSWLVSSLTAVHVLPSGIFHPPSSMAHPSQAVAPLRRCQWQLGVLKSLSSLHGRLLLGRHSQSSAQLPTHTGHLPALLIF